MDEYAGGEKRDDQKIDKNLLVHYVIRVVCSVKKGEKKAISETFYQQTEDTTCVLKLGSTLTSPSQPV